MTNPYIQNFITSRQQASVRPVSDNDTVNTQKQRPFYKSDVKPETPKGYLVKENMLQSLGSSITGLAKTGVYFVNAINGKGIDYTVGRINDGATFLGSLGIATALSSIAKTPKSKAMEFVGFATWFTSMALWPKALSAVTKAVKGVDTNQEYVDSYGRRKRFFEDAQYIPWDLYNDKDLYKMGDKLGVPKNIENRKEAIKEKAKQVSIQGNTLMMLTAGFATPITTALICNVLEGRVSKAVELHQLHKALNTPGSMPGSEKGLEQLRQLLGKKGTSSLEKSGQIRDLFKQFEGTGIYDGVEKELNSLLTTGIKLDAKTKGGLRNAFVLGDDVLRTFAGGSEETLNTLRKALTVRPEVFERRVIGDKAVLENAVEIKGSVRRLLNRRLEAAEKLLELKGEPVSLDKTGILGKVTENLAKEAETYKVVSAPKKALKNLYKVAHDFVARKNITDQYAKATIANVADSQTAVHWGKYPREVLKALGITGKVQEQIAKDPLKAAEYLEQHLRGLSDIEFNTAVEKVAKIAEKVVKRESDAAVNLTKSWHRTGTVSAKLAEKCGFMHLQTALKSAAELEKTNVENKLMNTKSSFYKPLLVLERLKDPKTSPEVIKELISGLGIDGFSNKFENRGVNNVGQFGKFVDETFAPLTKILQGKKNKGLRAGINEFYTGNKHIGKHRIGIKWYLSQIDGANRGFYHLSPSIQKMQNHKSHIKDILDKFGKKEILISEKKAVILKKHVSKIEEIFVKHLKLNKDSGINELRSDWTQRVGKNFVDFIRDAAKEQGIKNTWLKKVLFVAVPVATLSLLAISQFGKKNEYNPDIYQVKGNS